MAQEETQAAEQQAADSQPTTDIMQIEDIMNIDIKAVPMRDLIKTYNAHSGKPPVKRFADRLTAERRVIALAKSIGKQPSASQKTMPSTKAKKAAATKKAPAKKAAVKRESTGSIADSWKVKSVAAARSKKDKVKVGGTIYRSVLAAFEALKLDTAKHIRFRAELKAAGRKDFDGHTFTIVKADKSN